MIEDLLWSGNCYAQQESSITGKLLRLTHQPALYVRRRQHKNDYCWLNKGEVDNFLRDSIIHIKRYDPRQEVYGLPAYLSAMNHAFLNKSSTVYRRQYIDNGGHMGFILYLNSPDMEDETIEDIENALLDTTGDVGNLVIHDPTGSGANIQLLKLSEISNKDDFLNIQDISRDAVLAIHRVPPQVMSIIPANVGGFGSAAEAAQVFARNEIQYLQTRLNVINEQVGFELLRFNEYKIAKIN